jgi:autotransporter-associated beta strand protein
MKTAILKPERLIAAPPPQFMKTRLTMLKSFLTLCATFAATAVFGQTTYTWTNTAGGDLTTAANWNPNGKPSGSTQDTAQWDGVLLSSNVTYGSVDLGNTGFGTSGIFINLTPNQVGPVMIIPTSLSSQQIGLFSVNNFSANAALTIGNTYDAVTNAKTLKLTARPAAAAHVWVNNSTAPVTLGSAIEWQAGGGNAYGMEFSGPGDWIVNTLLLSDNGGDVAFTLDGPGTFKWTKPAAQPSNYNTAGRGIQAITINGGQLILNSAGLIPIPSFTGNGPAITIGGVGNPATLVWNAIGQSDTTTRPISGDGTLIVSNGNLTLAGANTYTGTNILRGGELIAGSVESTTPSGPFGEPTTPGTISFEGGVLGYSAFNGFDYSPRFATTPGQQYQIDTASANVTYTNGLTSSGGTLVKLGAGSLTLAGADTYNGLTTVNGGKLVLAGTAGSGNITVNDNAALGVVENGTAFTPGTLTLGTNFGATFEANNVTNQLAAPIVAATLVSSGPTTINVNSGRFRLIGDTFPLLAWGSGTAPATSLGFVSGAGAHLVTNLNSIQLVIDQPPYIWSGGNSASWDTSTPNNWVFNGGSATWANGNYVLFDDSLTANPSVTISGLITGKTVTFDNANTNYTLNSVDALNNLGGSTSLTMAGSGITTLAGGANTYTGNTTITGGGTLSVGTLANSGSASDIGAATSAATNLVLNGGTLIYTGSGATVDRLFMLGTASGTIDNEGSGPLALTNSGAMGLFNSGPRTLTLTGPVAGNVLAAAVGDGGGPTELSKIGDGTWTLTGNNTYSGGTVLSAGELIVGNGGTTGSLGIAAIANSGSIDINRTGSVTFGTISGTGSVTNDGPGTAILPNNNTFSGGLTINSGTVQVGNGGGTGELNANGNVVDNSLLVFNSSGSATFNGVISGTGNFIKQGAGKLTLQGANTYTGWTAIAPGANLQVCNGNAGALASPVITNAGTLFMDRQDFAIFIYTGSIVNQAVNVTNITAGRLIKDIHNPNAGDVTLLGTNLFSGGTIIKGGAIILGDNGVTPFGGTLGASQFNSTNFPPSWNTTNLSGNVTFTNSTGNDAGNGTGPSGFGSSERTLFLNRAEDITFSGNILGTTLITGDPDEGNLGQITLEGSGKVTLTGNNTYAGGTTVTAGALQIGNGGSTGSVGTGPLAINDSNNGLPLLINRSGSLAIPGNITGDGYDINIIGGVTVTLGGTNAYTGATTVTNSSLFINGDNISASIYVTNGVFGGVGAIAGPVTLDPNTTLYVAATATLANGGTPGTLTITNNLTLNGSNYVFEVNRDASPANGSVVVGGTLANNNTGPGFLIITNVGNNLQPGDHFVLFSQPLPNGAAISVSGGRAIWTNGLAVDGSVGVASVSPPPTLNFTNQFAGTISNNLKFSWSDSQSIFKLQWQTNFIGVGLSNNWKDYPGGGSSPVTVPIIRTNATAATAFFRIISVP